MNTTSNWLRLNIGRQGNSQDDDRKFFEAAQHVAQMERALEQLLECDFNDANCANFRVASARVRNIARIGLS